MLYSVSRKRNVSLSSLIYFHHFLNENRDNTLCKKFNNRVKFSISELVSTFPEILNFALDRCSFNKDNFDNVIDVTQKVINSMNINKTLNSNFNFLRAIYGSPIILKPIATVGKIGGESAQYGHFISYIIDHDAVTKLDDTKTKKSRLQFWTQIIFKDNFLLLSTKTRSHHFLVKKKE